MLFTSNPVIRHEFGTSGISGMSGTVLNDCSELVSDSSLLASGQGSSPTESDATGMEVSPTEGSVVPDVSSSFDVISERSSPTVFTCVGSREGGSLMSHVRKVTF